MYAIKRASWEALMDLMPYPTAPRSRRFDPTQPAGNGRDNARAGRVPLRTLHTNKIRRDAFWEAGTRCAARA